MASSCLSGSMWDLAPQSDQGWNLAPCNGSVESQPLDHQGSPRIVFLIHYSLIVLLFCLKVFSGEKALRGGDRNIIFLVVVKRQNASSYVSITALNWCNCIICQLHFIRQKESGAQTAACPLFSFRKSLLNPSQWGSSPSPFLSRCPVCQALTLYTRATKVEMPRLSLPGSPWDSPSQSIFILS